MFVCQVTAPGDILAAPAVYPHVTGPGETASGCAGKLKLGFLGRFLHFSGGFCPFLSDSDPFLVAPVPPEHGPGSSVELCPGTTDACWHWHRQGPGRLFLPGILPHSQCRPWVVKSLLAPPGEPSLRLLGDLKFLLLQPPLAPASELLRKTGIAKEISQLGRGAGPSRASQKNRGLGFGNASFGKCPGRGDAVSDQHPPATPADLPIAGRAGRAPGWGMSGKPREKGGIHNSIQQRPSPPGEEPSITCVFCSR